MKCLVIKTKVNIVFFTVACMMAALQANAQKDFTKYVDPFIGTDKMGHTYPGATVPFGAVQLSPDTDTIPYEMNGKYNPDVYRYCAGYQYADSTIVGFSHTHFSGTGHSDLGDILIMPSTGKLQLNPGTAGAPQDGYRSAFSHADETAAPGYYSVVLKDNDILAELTATARTGFHRYTFPGNDSAHIILDMMHGIYNYEGKNVWTFIRVENDTLVTGYRQTTGWARTRTVYFAISFSKPISDYGMKDYSEKQVYKGFWRKFDQQKNFPDMAGKDLRLYFNFSTTAGESISIKVALSPVSTSNAIDNMHAEIPHWNFDQVRHEAKDAWNKELSKIEIEAGEADKVNFYTAMYHAAMMPTLYMDVNGEYMGLDQQVHHAHDYSNYTSFSLWDTYRAFYPYMNLVNPSRNSDIIRSMLAHYEQSALHMLPVWSHYGNDNWCMSGYHSVSVIADAIVKGVFVDDSDGPVDACIATSTRRDYEGIGSYMDLGYIPEEKNRVSVSTTLEYAYDDWCIAQIAKKLGRKDLYDNYMKRADNWKNVFDSTAGFMRPRNAAGVFRKDFDVLKTEGQGFIEGNAWNYSLYVPHDPEGMIDAMGGNKKFVAHLDSLFTMELPDEFFAHTEDITREGIIGNYVHGNEPAHHAAYLYSFTDQPYKTQQRVRMIMDNQYHNGPAGLGGNDDCGQMSAWYIFSAMGFYPVAPGSDRYWIGSPLVKKAIIHLENGNAVTMTATNQ